MRTRPRGGNCLFGLLYLWWRGKVARVAVVSGESWAPHLVALTAKGHALHFLHGEGPDPLAPAWFRGSFAGVRRSRLAAELEASGRRLLWPREDR